MKLELIRTHGTLNETMGELYVDGKFFCYTLEDALRDNKIKSKTAIPGGEYIVKNTHSPRFNRILPLIYNDPKTYDVVAGNGDRWSGIRIHGGNTHYDTDGCILVAYNQNLNKMHPQKRDVYNWIQGNATEPLTKLIGSSKDGVTLSIKTVAFRNLHTYYTLRSPMIKDDNVFLIQRALNEKGYKVTEDGWFGSITHRAVVLFQKKNNLVPDGIVGPATQKALNINLSI